MRCLFALSGRACAVQANCCCARAANKYPTGRRFSGGGGGIYCGVKDLHLSEVSGAFSLSLEAVQQVPGSSGRSNSSSASTQEVRLKVMLSGISSSASSTE